jgi:hypothetical protein
VSSSHTFDERETRPASSATDPTADRSSSSIGGAASAASPSGNRRLRYPGSVGISFPSGNFFSQSRSPFSAGFRRRLVSVASFPASLGRTSVFCVEVAEKLRSLWLRNVYYCTGGVILFIFGVLFVRKSALVERDFRRLVIAGLHYSVSSDFDC